MSVASWYRRWAIQGPQHMGERLVYWFSLPFSFLYAQVGQWRARLYQRGVLPSRRVSVPVISVGNLVAGGTGKTPMVAWLLEWALEQNFRVAVVSRGYRGKRSSDILTVCQGDGPLVSAGESGDEPWLLASRFPKAIIVVGRDRFGAAECAIRDHAADLILLDDGFQHLRLQRDLNLLLLDARAPYGNGRVLPAGYLREPVSARSRADLVIFTHWGADRDIGCGNSPRTRHVLSANLLRLDGTCVESESVKGKTVAFCGIADPEAFFRQLAEQGYDLVESVGLPDHCEYSESILSRLNRLADRADFFLTTEKDGVKLSDLHLSRPCYQVPLQFEFVTGREQVDGLLHDLLDKDQTMSLSKELLDILACPQCKGPVELDPEKTHLVCQTCALKYPVRDDIPVMLIDEATSLSGEPATGE